MLTEKNSRVPRARHSAFSIDPDFFPLMASRPTLGQGSARVDNQDSRKNMIRLLEKFPDEQSPAIGLSG